MKKIKYISDVKLYNEIQNDKKILILDLRSREEYAAGHIALSFNIPFDEYDYEFFQSWCNNSSVLENKTDDTCIKLRLKNFKRYFIGIIISNFKINPLVIEQIINNSGDNQNDESSNYNERITKALLLYQSLMSNSVRELGLYNLGLEVFYGNYSFLMSRLGETPRVK